MRKLRNTTLALVGTLVAGGGAALLIVRPAGASQQAPPARPAGQDQGDELVKALLDEPGCLGVETAFTQSRKAAIFAWFKSKDALLDWYYSDFHQTAMMGLQEAAAEAAEKGELPYDVSGGDEADRGEPLAHLPDDCGPILAIATITPSQKQLVPGFDQSISQISIELYAPLPGGIAFNGRFAPAKLVVPHLFEMSADGSEAKPAAAPAGSDR